MTRRRKKIVSKNAFCFIIILTCVICYSHQSSIVSETELQSNEFDIREKEQLQNKIHEEDEYRRNLTMSRRVRRSYSSERFIQVLVAVDHKMKLYHEDSLQLYALTLMSTVAQIYRDASIGNAINIAVVKFVVMDENESRQFIRPSAPTTLRGFCWWQKRFTKKKRPEKETHDVAILITREDLCSTSQPMARSRRGGSCDTLGLAQLGRMCDPHSSCAVIEDNGLSASFTIAHELAHILNVPHDDDPTCAKYTSRHKLSDRAKTKDKDSGFIMSRMLHSSPWTWSDCSRGYLTEFLDSDRGQCLLDPPRIDLLNQQWPSVTSRNLVKNSVFRNSINTEHTATDHFSKKTSRHSNHRSHLRARTFSDSFNYSKLPGEIFNQDMQCQLVFGASFKICPFMSACERLWCVGPSGGCRTQHMPWADGTSCGDGHWCQRGSCVAINRVVNTKIDGSWGPWSPFTPCTRTCGGGIQHSTRECNNPSPRNGGKYCVGQRIKYASCNYHDCLANEPDFRDSQCSKFNGHNFGMSHLPSNIKWKPHYHNISFENSCKLWCNAVGTSAFYLLKSKVIDGTRCTDKSDDICVNGQCKPAGCDHIMYSAKKRDTCGVCGGNNSTCKLIEGTIKPKNLKFGYNSVMSLPANSSNVKIIQTNENKASSLHDINFLSLRDSEGKYIINGNFIVNPDSTVIDYDHRLNVEYSGYKSDQEMITIKEPLSKPMVVEVLSVGHLQPSQVTYQYSINVPVIGKDSRVSWKKKKKRIRLSDGKKRGHQHKIQNVLKKE